MTSKNTPNGGKILKVVHNVIRSGCVVEMNYGYHNQEHYPTQIKVRLPFTLAEFHMSQFDPILRWYTIGHVQNVRYFMDGGQERHSAQICLMRKRS